MERVDATRSDSDTALFYDLLFLGELVTKLTVAALVAGVRNDSERHRYRVLYRLVRADGIGDWTGSLSDLTTGPAAAQLAEGLRDDQRAISQQVALDSWQHAAVTQLDAALRCFDGNREKLPQKVNLQRWFAMFAELRNKTRGHGAAKASSCSEACPALERAVRLLMDNLPIFSRPWAYLHRNLSGKYRVVPLGGDPSPFAYLKSTATETLPDGVYVYAQALHRVELVVTNVDALDFYLPNGAFSDRKYELLSYISDDRSIADSAPYLAPVGALPASETQGLGRLEVQGNVFTNLPGRVAGYVPRHQLQEELASVLRSDRHQMVTLLGRGGVGKTSLALSVLHELSYEQGFTAILWFSARDIDLLPTGPKLVGASVLSEHEIGREFVQLMAPEGAKDKGFSATQYLAEQLTRSEVGPLLFVFDNFETVRNPRELYAWIDTYIRPPNKALITTRFREFKGDYAVSVSGMTEAECEQLIRQTASSLGISHLITSEYVAELYREADGHPYVVKVLLGEVARERKLLKVERIIANQEEILEALFERTYAALSPAARRVFLLLSRWRSAIPEMAVEAILLRPANERMDVRGAIEELTRMSFIELWSSEDGAAFVTVPIAAQVFGRRKLAVSPFKAAVEADAHWLFSFGAARESDLRQGVGSRVEQFFRAAAEKVGRGQVAIDEYQPILEYLARQHAPGWLLLATLLEENGRVAEARASVENYLEHAAEPNERIAAWQRVADLAKLARDPVGEIHALVELAQQSGVEYSYISRVANRINGVLKETKTVDSDEKRILIRKLIDVMMHRSREATATDFSRLAWLFVNIGDLENAATCVDQGLAIDPSHEHLTKLSGRLRAEGRKMTGNQRR